MECESSGVPGGWNAIGHVFGFLLLQTTRRQQQGGVVAGRTGSGRCPSPFILYAAADGGLHLPDDPASNRWKLNAAASGRVSRGRARRLPQDTRSNRSCMAGSICCSPLKISSDDSAELLIGLAIDGPSPTVSVSGRVTGIALDQFQRIH